MAKLDAFFKLMFDTGASDLHIVSGQPPILRVHGELERVKYDPLDDENLRQMLYEIAPEQKIKTFEETGDVDFGYEIPNVARFRANFFMQKYGCGAVFRQIPTKVLTADDLGPAADPQEVGHAAQGAGAGHRADRLRQVHHAGRDDRSRQQAPQGPHHHDRGPDRVRARAARAASSTTARWACTRSRSRPRCAGALREDPDIILVGEMRDLETIRLALEAANTGHLVFGTLHTTSAAKTIDRIIDVFPAEEQDQIRNGLSDRSRSSSRRTSSSASTRRAAARRWRSWCARPPSANLIREGKTVQIPSAIQTGKQFGMQTLDDAIMGVLQKGWISPDEAYDKCIDKSKFRPLLKTPPDELNQ